MTVHDLSAHADPALIHTPPHRLIAIHAAAERARAALEDVRAAAWNNGLASTMGDDDKGDAESRASARVTAAVDELMTLALLLDEDAS